MCQLCSTLVAQINGINGTMIANRYERVNATSTYTRTVITLNNGGEWSHVSPPGTSLTGAPILCEPPGCSLHFHMDTSDYARLGVYSQVQHCVLYIWQHELARYVMQIIKGMSLRSWAARLAW